MAADSAVNIRPTIDADRAWMREEMRKWWGSELVVVRGEKFYPAEMNGFIAENADEIVGLILLRYDSALCEIMSLTTSGSISDIGRQLIKQATDDAKIKGSKRLIVVTTNDNMAALRFYQKSGFVIREWRKGAVNKSRKIKPEIPLIGNYHIPIRDEIELELTL